MDERTILRVPHGFCYCGCGERTKIATRTNARDGHVRGEPLRYINRHARRGFPFDYIEYFDTGCWVWQLRKEKGGYGIITRGKRTYLAHRYVYEQQCGPIPADLELDHLCRNCACVNPAHLEPVSSAENVRRSRVAKLTETEVVEIRSSSEMGRDLAKRYGVSESLISQIRLNQCWKELESVGA